MVEKPEIGSIWKARDGRRMEVKEIVETPHVKHGWWAKLDVLPPYVSRQRRSSDQAAVSFVDGFLTLEPSDDYVKPFSP